MTIWCHQTSVARYSTQLVTCGSRMHMFCSLVLLKMCDLVFFMHVLRPPTTSTISSWHNKHAACLLAH